MKDPHITYLPPYVDPRSHDMTDGDWERLYNARVKANIIRRNKPRTYVPPTDVPDFLRKQAS